MANPMTKIHNVQTHEIIEREMTDAEYADWKTQCAEWEKLKAERVKEEVAKLAAQTKLAALGLSSEDLKALGL